MKKKIGKVISDKMDKSRVIAIDDLRRHRIYHTTYIKTSKIMAHDENNEYVIGDTVEIQEVRPISVNKAWKITRKVK